MAKAEAPFPSASATYERSPGYAVSSPEELGEGPGFRKVRSALGVNAIVLPGGYATDLHFHDEQQELYFVHSGEIEMRFGDGGVHRLGPGGLARVDASTDRGMRNVGGVEAVLPVTEAKDGYIGTRRSRRER